MNPATTSLSSDESPRLKVALGLLAWLAIAVAIGGSGLLTLERGPLIPASIATLVGALVWLYSRGGAFRLVADDLDLRWLILPHFVRAPIGAAFLWKWSQGELDTAFAWVGGPGDLLAGVLALGAALLVPATTKRRRLAVVGWNVVALGDILLTAATAMRVLLFSGHPETMAAFFELPWPLLPLFLVPLVITSHVLMLRRLRLGAD